MCCSNIVPAAFRRSAAAAGVLSNINCHRRKTIYSVRTPIINLHLDCSTHHHSMAVFDDIERNELGPRPYARNPTSFPQRHRLAREFKQFEVAVLERRVRLLIDTYAGQGVRFFAPGVAFDDVEKISPGKTVMAAGREMSTALKLLALSPSRAARKTSRCL